MTGRHALAPKPWETIAMPQTKSKQTVSHVRAREPATGTFEGEPFVVNPSEIFAADHPLVRAYPHLFKPGRAHSPAPRRRADDRRARREAREALMSAGVERR
jgi:hypothetical protein